MFSFDLSISESCDDQYVGRPTDQLDKVTDRVTHSTLLQTRSPTEHGVSPTNPLNTVANSLTHSTEWQTYSPSQRVVSNIDPVKAVSVPVIH